MTVTHPDVVRYFMLIPEAAQLVLQAGLMGQGGEIFVLDMGESVKIVDLARRMIELTGLRVKDIAAPDGDIAIEFTGLRPGEKLYEELLIGNDPRPTAHPRIMKAREVFLEFDDLVALLNQLIHAVDVNDVNDVRTILHTAVPGYQPDSKVVDLLYCKTNIRESKAL